MDTSSYQIGQKELLIMMEVVVNNYIYKYNNKNFLK